MKKASGSGKRRPASAGHETTIIDTVKKVKTRMKEEKEIKKLFESIAERLLNESKHAMVVEAENRCREMLSRTVAEIRHEVFNIESSVSTRITNLESKLNQISIRIDEMQIENNKSHANLHEEILSSNRECKLAIENERNKRLTSLKKIHDQHELSMSNIQNSLNQNKAESVNAVTALNEDIRVHSKELTSLKDKLDEILIKQYGYLPHSKIGPNDGNAALDALTQRLQRLEVAVSNNEDELNTSLDFNARSTPLRATIGNKSTLGRVRKLEEHVMELQSQIKENEIDIQHMKSNLVHNLRGQGSSFSPVRERYRDDEGGRQILSGGVSYSDFKDMDKRIKRLAENTTKACRSLSNGLTEVQQATLNLYAWTDEVHNAFDRVAPKVELPNNLCPRAKVISRSSKENKFDFS